MINGWNSHYHIKPIIDGDFDYYKITFPTTKTSTKTSTETITKKDNEQIILATIQKNPHLTSEDIAKQINISRAGVRYHISNLTKKGIIKRTGSSKKGKWEIQKK